MRRSETVGDLLGFGFPVSTENASDERQRSSLHHGDGVLVFSVCRGPDAQRDAATHLNAKPAKPRQHGES